MPPPQQQANNSSQLQATSGSSAEAPATQPVAQDPIHPQQGSRGALMKFGKVTTIRSPRTEMSPAYKTWRPPLPPHGSPATDPRRLSSTACRGKISAKRDNSRYQPLTSLAAEVPGQHHQKLRKSKPSHPNHYHPAISLAVRAHNSSCQRHPACPRLSNCTGEQARHEAGD